ncbi:MerR family transcriptional regulator [Paenibacillus oryzisoli]|uniref:helix-turn-helix domain-containing protein n=1 Tax=Paenibacillus oryzisoli TaxID=1850517 RepID=UPI003D2D0247
MDTFKIDDVAKECGLTKRTIRYWEEIGLLMAPERSEGGMRLYTRQHIERLQQIMKARDVLGYTLQEIQEFVAIREELLNHRQTYLNVEDQEQKKQELLEMKRIVSQQIEMVDQKLETLKEFRKELDQMTTRIENGLVQLQTTPRKGDSN